MMKIAAIQMVSGDNVADNLENAQRLISLAVEQHAKLIVLPENFALISPNESAKLAIKEPLGSGPLQTFLATQAAKHKITLVGGTIPLQTDDENKVFAASLVYDEKGQCISHYRKIHLFDVQVESDSYQESEAVVAGDEIVVVELPYARLGLSVCYDIRFPELYRQMALQKVDIIVIPAAFTLQTGRAHWDILARARAIENLCYVIAADQGGEHPGGRLTYGHSMIVGPWGDVLASCEQGEGVVVADYDSDAMHAIRRSFPATEHRRLS